MVERNFNDLKSIYPKNQKNNINNKVNNDIKNRTFIIQSIINEIGAKDYLEIGLFQ